MENWLVIVVGGFLLAMVLYGHYKGFIHMAVAIVSLILSLVAVRVLMPEVTAYLQEKTPIYEMLQEQIKEKLSLEFEDSDTEEGNSMEMLSAAQKSMIEELPLPSTLKKSLLENNNSEIYQRLGVEQFGDYVTKYISTFLLQIVAYVLTLILIFIVVRFVLGLVNIIARLPVLNGMNQLAGAVLGGAEGLLIVWLAFLIITIFSGTETGMGIISQIEGNSFLRFLYENNLLQAVVIGSMKYLL